MPLLLRITLVANGEYEGVVPAGRECKEEAKMIADHVTLVVMYYLIFDINAHQDDTGTFTFIRGRFSKEHVKIVMEHSSYDKESEEVTRRGHLPPDG